MIIFLHHSIDDIVKNDFTSYQQVVARGFSGLRVHPTQEAKILEELNSCTADHHHDLNDRDADGYTPLHKVAALGSVALVERMLDMGAWMTIGGPLGQTPLMMAAANGHDKVVEALMRHGANPNDGVPTLPHALHRAAEGGHLDLTERLLAAGADPSALDHRSRTPVQVAQAHGQPVVAAAIERSALTSFADSLTQWGVDLLDEPAHAVTPSRPRSRL